MRFSIYIIIILSPGCFCFYLWPAMVSWFLSSCVTMWWTRTCPKLYLRVYRRLFLLDNWSLSIWLWIIEAAVSARKPAIWSLLKQGRTVKDLSYEFGICRNKMWPTIDVIPGKSARDARNWRHHFSFFYDQNFECQSCMRDAGCYSSPSAISFINTIESILYRTVWKVSQMYQEVATKVRPRS